MRLDKKKFSKIETIFERNNFILYIIIKIFFNNKFVKN